MNFEKYIGKTVKVIESDEVVSLETRTFTVKGFKISPEETIIDEIKEIAKSEDLVCRIWLPNTIGTMDVRRDRLNVKIKKSGEDFIIYDMRIG
jgi:hypothetical protein